MYSENGTLFEDANYKNNRYNGECTFFDPKTGKLLEKGIYENGKMIKLLEGGPAKR